MSDINSIKPAIPGGPHATRNAGVEEKRSGASAPTVTGTANTLTDKVSLTATATQLQSLQQEIAALPIVDEQKVAALKAAIEEGRYQIDSQKLARNMIDFEGNR